MSDSSRRYVANGVEISNACSWACGRLRDQMRSRRCALAAVDTSTRDRCRHDVMETFCNSLTRRMPPLNGPLTSTVVARQKQATGSASSPISSASQRQMFTPSSFTRGLSNGCQKGAIDDAFDESQPYASGVERSPKGSAPLMSMAIWTHSGPNICPRGFAGPDAAQRLSARLRKTRCSAPGSAAASEDTPRHTLQRPLFTEL